ncbi:MAG: hypothetical protein SGARI_003292 [Bacillariaceae sp.]
MSSDHEYSTEGTPSPRSQEISIPMLTKVEIRSGTLLGRGTFCNVSTVKSITLKELSSDTANDEARKQLAKRYENISNNDRSSTLDIYGKQDHGENTFTGASPRLAIKELKDIANKDRLRQAQEDLQRECEILQHIQRCCNNTQNSGKGPASHPNIIELFAIGVDSLEQANVNGNTKIQPTFLVVSKMRTTLQSFLTKWREQRGIGVFEFLGIGVQESQDLWLQRLLVLSKIANAVAFLHEHRVIFRDLKSDNIAT